MITAEIGYVRRFNSAKKIKSGDKCYVGHISKQGNTNLRWILVECANIAIMHE